MVLYQGVCVSVVAYNNKQRYREYQPIHQTVKRAYSTKEVYIEATTGERFGMVVDLTAAFDFKSSPDVKVRYLIDVADAVAGIISEKDRNEGQDHWDTQHIIDGKWMTCGFTFAELRIDDESTQEKVAQDLKIHGVIIVEVIRGKVLEENSATLSSDRLDTKVASKDVVKKHHVSHALQHTPIDNSECEPPTYAARFEKAKGRAGTPLRFIFRYRSRMSLELLKIIPEEQVTSNATPSSTQTKQHPFALSATSAPTQFGTTATAGTKHDREIAQAPGAPGEPPQQRIKTEINSIEQEVMREAGASESNLKQERPAQVVKSEDVEAPKSRVQTKRAAPVIVLDDDDDEIEVVETCSGPTPLIQPARTPATSVAAAQSGISADRERKKKLLNIRLEELRIERELMEMD